MTSRQTKAALLAFTTALLAPVWWYPYFPTGDGPSHLYNAEIIKQAILERGNQLQYYRVALEPLPNWAGHAILTALLFVASAATAHQLFVSIYLLAWAGGIVYYLRSAGSFSSSTAILGLNLGINLPFMLGFYNFSLGVVVYLLTLGFWCRGKAESRAGILGLGLLLLVGYFCHFLTFVITLSALVGVWGFSRERRNNQLWRLALAALPALGLALWYCIHGMRATAIVIPTGEMFPLTLAGWTKKLSALDCIWYGDRWQRGTALLVSAAWLGLLAVSLPRQWRSNTALSGERPGLFYFSLLLLAAGFILPGKFGEHGSYLPTRLVLLGMVTGLASFSPLESPNWRRASAIAVIGLMLASVVHLVRYEARANRQLDEFLAGLPAIGRGRVFLPVISRRSSFRVDPLSHASDYYALAGDNVDLANYETSQYYFPVRLRPGVERPADLATILKAFDSIDPQRMARAVDALIVWGKAPASIENGHDFRGSFQSGPLRIYTSALRGGA